MLRRDKEQYRSLLPPENSLYLQPDFLDSVTDDWTAFLSYNDREQIEWMLPMTFRSRLQFQFYGPARVAHNNGIVILNDTRDFKHSADEILDLGEVVISNRKPSRNEGDLYNAFTSVERNYQYYDLHNYPRSIDDINSKSMRNNIRKCRSFTADNEVELPEFYELYQLTMERSGGEIMSTGYWNKMIASLQESYDVQLWALKNENGSLLSGSLFVGHGDTIYGIMKAKNYSINQRGAQEYLVYHIIQEMREKYQFWDLGGSNISGIKRFNMKMGALNESFPVYSLYKPPFLGKVLKWWRS